MNGKQKGFTLLELLVVMAIISILVSIGLPQYKNAQRKAKEAVLKENLFRMRDVIDQYHADKGYYPESLETLTDDGYLRSVPVDPVTKTSTSWIIVFEEDVSDRDPNIPIGVYDVKSGASGTSIDGIPYSEF
ncbi:MAG: hypothetical protein A2Y62_01345 [Candidatus Fischerbacteria bacterium RBG_13_37_8]|uniref:Type II secretion system protein GspG C-terminal domain-containing protein n=1 Tax=Candidatus Fischerbacteria bacterium RBG_13_37_8 TaxID=1817863 RepID=A0A1F5VTQ4_9BACT|nr:MAG: hypothetical protein A2Y62_01345 [Candidatus Fischerbacteria bacterium RBG_13_37_8]